MVFLICGLEFSLVGSIFGKKNFLQTNVFHLTWFRDSYDKNSVLYDTFLSNLEIMLTKYPLFGDFPKYVEKCGNLGNLTNFQRFIHFFLRVIQRYTQNQSCSEWPGVSFRVEYMHTAGTCGRKNTKNHT